MTNKKLGNDFEEEFCEILAKNRFWCHIFAQNKAGQPADVIAVKNGHAYLIDCKVCGDRGFALSRMEENQDCAMTLWKRCGNGEGWFAMHLPTGDIYMVPHYVVKEKSSIKSYLTLKDITNWGYTLRSWMWNK